MPLYYTKEVENFTRNKLVWKSGVRGYNPVFNVGVVYKYWTVVVEFWYKVDVI